MEGYIKIHRKILENPIVCKDAETMAIWLYLLLNATYKPYDVLFNGCRISLKPGQLITGRLKIAKTLHCTESKVERTLTCFESEQQIKQQKTTRNRLITILNWDKYQVSEQPFEQQMNNKRTTSEQQVNTNNNIKNIKNKEKKNNKEKVSLEEIELYIQQKGLHVDAKQFFNYFEEGNWIDSKGNKVKNWKQKLLTWEKYSSKVTPLKKLEYNYNQEPIDLMNIYEN